MTIKELNALNKKATKLTKLTEEHTAKLNMHGSNIQELYARMKIAENGIEELRAETMRLASCKTEVTTFNKTRKQLNLKNLE